MGVSTTGGTHRHNTHRDAATAQKTKDITATNHHEETAMGMEHERRATDYLADRMTELEQKVDAMPAAFEAAFRRVLADEKLVADFWHRGYRELADHAGNGASQWIGKRLLTTLVAAVVTAGLVWLVRTGAIK